MSQRKEKILLLLVDFIAVNIAWGVYYYIRVESGFLNVYASIEFLLPMFIIYIFWLLMFLFFGLYGTWYTKSRVDEFTTAFKAITVGTIALFFIIFIDDVNNNVKVENRYIILFYWVYMVLFVGFGRAIIHSIQKKLLEKGIGLLNTLIVGWNSKAKELFDSILKHQSLGYNVVGFLSTGNNINDSYKSISVLGNIDTLEKIIEMHEVREILIAVESSEHNQLLKVISKCEPYRVGIKIVPDLFDIVTGQARTNQIYGFPLINIMPQLMTDWERALKRMIDIFVSAITLILLIPLWVIIAIVIKIESKGKILYRQERVGKDGKYFVIFKFRSMSADAEKKTGPTWAGKSDPRVTKVGNFLRKSHLDEFPQLMNVLKGDMSLIGPRPERPFFVEQLSQEIPLYKRRLKVRPGITGWAQVKHKYDESIEDVKIKLQYDLFYIENISIKMDLKIALYTLYSMLTGKGQ